MNPQESSFSNLESLMLQNIKDRVIIPSNPPRLFLVVGSCRTATGALATTIGRNPTVSQVHIQPLKAFARQFLQKHRDQSSSTPLEFLKPELEFNSDSQHEILKETLGPDIANPAEFINPLAILLDSGFPPEKIVLIPTSRDPLETFTSWKAMWRFPDLDSFPFQGFNQSFTMTQNIINLAKQNNIPVVPYIHDLLKIHGSQTLIQSIFRQLNLEFHSSTIKWGNEDAYWTKTVKYDQPPKRWIIGALGKKSGGRGGFIWKPIKKCFTPTEEKQILTKIAPATKVHQHITRLATTQLGL